MTLSATGLRTPRKIRHLRKLGLGPHVKYDTSSLLASISGTPETWKSEPSKFVSIPLLNYCQKNTFFVNLYFPGACFATPTVHFARGASPTRILPVFCRIFQHPELEIHTFCRLFQHRELEYLAVYFNTPN